MTRWCEAKIAVYALAAPGLGKARELAAVWPGAELFVNHRLVEPGEMGFSRFSLALGKNFRRFDGHVVFGAAGIVVRSLQGILRGKDKDPAVVVLDQAGRYAVSLLSGHLGGANDLARELAGVMGAEPVITTATDSQGLPSLEMVARDAGLKIENLSALSRISGALLSGEKVKVYDPGNWLMPRLEKWPDCFERVDGLPEGDRGRPLVSVTPEIKQMRQCLVMRPPCLALGMGCNRGTGKGPLLDLAREGLAKAGLSEKSIAVLASAEIKRDEEGLILAAAELGVSLMFFSSQELDQVTVPNPSLTVKGHVGAKSVCEAAAILAAKGGGLLVSKKKTSQATLAVAEIKTGES